jgi:hypothetical protein
MKESRVTLQRDLLRAGEYSKALCMARTQVGFHDAWVRGASHYVIALSWENLGCRGMAVEEILRSVKEHPAGRARDVACGDCARLTGQACTSCP